MLQDILIMEKNLLNLMEERAEEMKRRNEKVQQISNQTDLLTLGMESIVCGRVRKEYPDLAKAYKQGKIDYSTLLKIYNILEGNL